MSDNAASAPLDDLDLDFCDADWWMAHGLAAQKIRALAEFERL